MIDSQFGGRAFQEIESAHYELMLGEWNEFVDLVANEGKKLAPVLFVTSDFTDMVKKQNLNKRK